VKVHVVPDTVQDVCAEDVLSSFDVVIATDLNFRASQRLNAACRSLNKPFYAGGSHGLYGFIFADLISHDFTWEHDRPNIVTTPGKQTLTRTVLDVHFKNNDGKFREVVTTREIYSPILLASTSQLPPAKTMTELRKKRKTIPLLSCIRTIWDFEMNERVVSPQNSTDVRDFTALATKKHSELGLPAETLNAEFVRRFLQNVGCEIVPVTSILGGLLAQDVINVIGKKEQPIQNLCLFDGDAMNSPVYALHPHNSVVDEERGVQTNGLGPMAKWPTGSAIVVD
jgi:ubiquitin-like 1-activating enzyme E1 A